MTALSDHRCHADKAVADLVLTLGQRRSPLNRLTEVDAVAITRGGCSGGWVASSIFSQVCCPSFLGLANAPETELIPGSYRTIAILFAVNISPHRLEGKMSE